MNTSSPHSYEKKQINTQAKRDLVEKLRLERIFRPEVNSLFLRMREDFKVQVAATGSAPPASNYSASWQGLLAKHYKRVQKAFSGTVKEFNKKSLIGFEKKQDELTQEEEDNLEELLLLALLLYRNERTVEQEAFITRTNDKQMQEAIAQARQTLEEQELPTDNRSIAATAAVIIARKFKGRTEGIITLETQAPAEATKLFEARTMAGLAPSLEAAPLDQVFRPREAELFKTWRTIGDKVVRDAHKRANFQKVPINDPFIVMGQMLMHPGDPSMGATIGNVVNCLHPSSVVDFASPTKITRRWYVGKMITIKLHSGNEISVTPNHPILSDVGFIKAQEIIKGQKVVCGNFLDGNSSYHNVKNRKPTIEQIFSSFGESCISMGNIDSIVDFHGDISNQNVDIIGMDGGLLDAWQAKFNDPFSKLVFSDSDLRFISKFSLRYKFSMFNSTKMFISKFSRSFSSFSCLFFSLFNSCLAPFKTFGLTLCSYGDIVEYENFVYCRSAKSSFFGNFVNRFPRFKRINNWFKMFFMIPFKDNFPGFSFCPSNIFKDRINITVSYVESFLNFCQRQSINVCFSDVVSINHFDYSGYVYNLEDDKSYYICNGIVNHNCRCSAIYSQ